MPSATVCPPSVVADTIMRTIELGMTITDAAVDEKTTTIFCAPVTATPDAQTAAVRAATATAREPRQGPATRALTTTLTTTVTTTAVATKPPTPRYAAYLARSRPPLAPGSVVVYGVSTRLTLLDCCKPFHGTRQGSGVGPRKVSGASVRCVHRLNCRITTRVVGGQVRPATLGAAGLVLGQRCRPH